MKDSKASTFFEQKSGPEVDRFVDLSLAIADRAHQLLEDKNMSQKDLAVRLGKSEAEVSKWLSGTHNFTLKSVAKLEVALEEKLLTAALGDHLYASTQKKVAIKS